MQYLKADTITEVVVGPAVAVGDGFTPVTSLVGATADEFEIIKHGATTTTTIAGTLAAVTGADGYYALDLSATDTNTEGRLTLLINDDSLILPIRMEFMVVAANVFDSLFAVAGTDTLDVQVTGIGSAVVTATAMATDSITSAELATSAVDEIVDQVWDELQSGHVAAGSMGEIATEISAIDLKTDSNVVKLGGGTHTASSSTTLTIATIPGYANDELNGNIVKILTGVGLGQSRLITDFDAATDVVTVSPAWTTNPAASGTYEIVPTGGLLPADVNTEVSDVIKTDTYTLPGQEAPPLAPTLEQAIMWLYKVLRNAKQQTATEWRLMADDETTVDAKATISDTGSLAAKTEIATGP